MSQSNSEDVKRHSMLYMSLKNEPEGLTRKLVPIYTILIAVLFGLYFFGYIGLLASIAFIASLFMVTEIATVKKFGLNDYLNTFSIRKTTRMDLYYLAIGLSITIITIAIGLTYIPQPSDSHPLLDIDFNALSYIFIITSMFLLFVPVEEHIFRDKIQNYLLSKKSPLKAILITNILFSLAHIGMYPIDIGFTAIVPFSLAFFHGCLFSVQYMKTDNLMIPIITHTWYNTITLTLVAFL